MNAPKVHVGIKDKHVYRACTLKHKHVNEGTCTCM